MMAVFEVNLRFHYFFFSQISEGLFSEFIFSYVFLFVVAALHNVAFFLH